MRPGDAKRVFDLAVGRSAPPLASMVTIFAISFHSPTLVAQFSIALSFASLFFVLPASIGAIFFSEIAASKDKGQSDSLISLLFWLVLLYTGVCFILVYWLPVISKTLISGLPEELLDGAVSQARLIILCIPFFGIINVCSCVLESRSHTAIVAKFRMWQVFFHAACVIVVLVLLGRNEWMSDDSVALAYLFSDIIFSIAAYALMRKYCQFGFSFNFRGLPGRRIFSVLIPGYANSFFGKYLLYILSMSVAGLGAMYSAIQSQASAILLLAELPAMGVCALLAMEISKNRGRWAVQFQFIKDSSSLMIYCAIIPAVALFVFMLFYEISMANGYQIVGEGFLSLVCKGTTDVGFFYAAAISGGLGLYWSSRIIFWVVYALVFFAPMSLGFHGSSYSMINYVFSFSSLLSGALLVLLIRNRRDSLSEEKIGLKQSL